MRPVAILAVLAVLVPLLAAAQTPPRQRVCDQYGNCATVTGNKLDVNGVQDSTTGATVSVGDAANQAIRVNIVAGATGGGGAPTSSTYTTSTDETATLLNSRRWVNGTHSTVNTGTASQIKLDVDSASGVGSCPANQYATATQAWAGPTCSQVAWSQLSGAPALPLSGPNGGLGAVQPTCAAGQHVSCDGTTCSCTADTGTGAPTTSKYILQQADGLLPNAQSLGALSTGLLKSTTTTGVLSIAASGTDYAPATSGSALLLGNGTGGFSNYAGSSCSAGQAPLGLTTAGVVTGCFTPAGTYTLPNATASTLGGVIAPSCSTGNHYSSVSSGTLQCTADTAGGGGAPTTSTYILQQADASLPNAQALGALGTGVLKSTTSTGVVSTAGAGDIPAAGVDGQVQYRSSGGLGASSNLVWDSANQSLLIGPSPSVLPHSPITAQGNGNFWYQVNLQNTSAGASASSDYVATADTGTDSVNYIDLGINSSGYSDSSYTMGGALDGYLYTNGGHLTVGTQTAGKCVKFHTGGTLSSNVRTTVCDASLTLASGVSLVMNGSLGTGLLKHTTGTGVLSVAVAGTDYQAPLTLPLSIANGGTNTNATPTNGGVGYGTGTALAYTGAGTSGQLLKSGAAGTPTWGPTIQRLAVSGSNFTTTSTSNTTITGLSWSGTSGVPYFFECHLAMTGSSTGGPRASVTSSGTSTVISYTITNPTSSATTQNYLSGSASGTQTTTCTTSCLTVDLSFIVRGMVVPSASVTLAIAAANSTSGQTTTVKIGSTCLVWSP